PDFEFSYAISGDSDEIYPTELHLFRREAPRLLTNRYGRTAQLTPLEVFARLTFKDWGLTAAETRARLGPAIRTRLPSSSSLYSIDSYRDQLASRHRMRLSGARWGEVLLVAALTHAKEAVVLVAPPQFVISDQVCALERSLGKRIVRIPSSYYTG